MSTTIQSPDTDTNNANYDQKKQPVGYEGGAGTPGRSTDRDRNNSTTDREENRNKSGQGTERSGGSMGSDSKTQR